MAFTELRQEQRDNAAAIREVIGAIAAGHRTKDAAAIARHYAAGARIADLAPPLLRSGFDADGI